MTASVTTQCQWSAAPSEIALGQQEVHVWRATLDQDASRVQNLWPFLSSDEQARARRFHFWEHRWHYIVGRGLLRTLLGRYLKTDPAHLSFAYSPYDKPSLAAEFEGDAFSFNLSHANGMALYAFTRNRRIGVDLEYLRSDILEDEVAEHFFAPAEVATLHSLPQEAQVPAFFACWTRKEAFVKAVGEGLSIPLDQFEVSLRPGEPAALLRTLGDASEADRWSMVELHPGPNFKGALCTEGRDLTVKCWQWNQW